MLDIMLIVVIPIYNIVRFKGDKMSQTIELNIVPNGETPIFYTSQYDNGRNLAIKLKNGDDDYNVPEGYSVKINERKVDAKIVILIPDNVTDNIITFHTTTQFCACSGVNICTLEIYDDNDIKINSLYFYNKVQRDALSEGINSDTEIQSLDTLIASEVEKITPPIVRNIAPSITEDIVNAQVGAIGGTWFNAYIVAPHTTTISIPLEGDVDNKVFDVYASVFGVIITNMTTSQYDLTITVEPKPTPYYMYVRIFDLSGV